MARWLSHKPPLPTWHGNITLNDFISSHFILSLWGISKCVFHAPGSLIKCRGSLVVRPPRKPDYSQHFPDIMLPEADSAQASRRCLSEFSSGSRVFQTSPDYMFRIRQYTDFLSPDFNVPSTIHVHLARHNQALRETAPCRYQPFLSVVGCLLNSRKLWCSGLLFGQPSSVEIVLNAVKLPLVFVGACKTPFFIGDTRDPCTQTFAHSVPCHNPALRETAPCRYQPCLSVVGCLLNSRKLWCSGLLLAAFSAELALSAVKLPLVLCWSKPRNVTDIWAPCSMSQHNTVGSSTLHWGPFFWFAKSCPSVLVCVESPE